MKLKHRTLHQWFCERVGRLRQAAPRAIGDKPSQLSSLSRLVWALLAAWMLIDCNLATLAVAGAGNAPASDQGKADPVAAPVLPAPPAPLAVSLKDPEKSARTLVDALAGPDKLAAWLGLYQVLGIPVIDANGVALDRRDDRIGPLYWQIWYTATLDQPGRGILLSDAGRLLGLLFGLNPQEAQTLGDTLLFDLRFALGSEEPAVRLLAAVARERILRCGLKLDIENGATTAQTASLDIPMVQVIFWGALRGALPGALARLPAQSALPPVGDPSIRIAQEIHRNACRIDSSDDVIKWIIGKFGSGVGVGLPEDVQKAWGTTGKMLPGTIKMLQQILSVSKDTIEITGQVVSGVNVAAAAVSFLMQLAAMDVVGIQNPDKLERTKGTKNGKTATITWRLESNPGRWTNGDQLTQCTLSLLSSALGVTVTFPEEKRIAGAELKFTGGEGFPDRVLFGNNEQIRSWTNEEGLAELLILGRAQKKQLPETATAVDKEYSVLVSAQPEEAGLKSMASIFLGGFTFGLAPGPAGGLKGLVEILKTFTYDMGEYVFPMIDWIEGPYEAYASSLASQFTEKDICHFDKPFALRGSVPGFSSGFGASFTPKSSTHGDVIFTNNVDVAGCVEFFRGAYEVVFYEGGEGDIIMKGTLTVVCKNSTRTIQTQFRIAIRPNSNIVCPEN